ncbi:MAG: hypothetical protein U1G07_00885 [Verrucomicrobiota bacterium]
MTQTSVAGRAASPVSLPLASPALPGSIDRLRMIRRSVRCFVFGAIGLIPIAGAGLAVQALQLHRSIRADLGEAWRPPLIAVYWIGGAAGLWAIWRRFGWPSELLLAMTLLAVQSLHVFWRMRTAPRKVWNPGRRALTGGVILAYAGLSGSWWAVTAVLYRLLKGTGQL